MTKQTVVEWLVDNLHYLHSTKWNDILEQAKEMDKEQKIIDYEMGYINGGNQKSISGEQYYNKTYGGSNEIW